MVICPIALTAGCKKCPFFKLCPAKGIIGDYKKEEDSSQERNEREEENRNSEN